MNYLQTDEDAYTIIKGSPLSLFLYNREFNRDLLLDISQSFNGGEVINKSLASKIVWTLCKTYSEEVIDYSVWIKLVKYDFSSSWSTVISNECNRAFSIKTSGNNVKNPGITKEVDARGMAIGILTNSKRMGLNFKELNYLTLQDYIDFVDQYTGKESNRIATQDDIDKLFS